MMLWCEGNVFQDDKDLVHEFVNNDGLECLMKVGSEADQNYQNYILRGNNITNYQNYILRGNIITNK